jgi:hypothetical protein
MAGTTPLQLLSFPQTTDQASPASIQTLAQAVEKLVVAVFPDAATRDSRWASAGGLGNGAPCFLQSTGELQLRSAGAWVVIGGRAAPFAHASGQRTFSLTAGNSSSIASNVGLPTGRFSVAPVIFATLAGAPSDLFQGAIINATGISTTAFDLQVTSINPWGTTQTCAVSWLAIQMTSVAATG